MEDGVVLAGMGAWAAPTGLVAMVVAQDPAMVAAAPTGPAPPVAMAVVGGSVPPSP